MKATELRIGNLVMNGSRLTRVDSLSIAIDDWDRTNNIRTQDFEPIPLTEEWLVKFGWGVDKDYENSYFDIVSIEQAMICYDTNHRLLTLETERGDLIQIRIEHLHQLQNLYFALTNRELEISE